MYYINTLTLNDGTVKTFRPPLEVSSEEHALEELEEEFGGIADFEGFPPYSDCGYGLYLGHEMCGECSVYGRCSREDYEMRYE